MRLNIERFAFFESMSMELGDLTVLVGPQATGKTLLLELIKLVHDRNAIVKNLKKHGFSCQNREEFLQLYFGEGLESVYRDETKVSYNGNVFTPWPAKGKTAGEKVFYIPAQRVLALKDGWPRPLSDYQPGDPYVVKKFSEDLRVLMEKSLGAESARVIFPKEGRLPKPLRDLLEGNIFRRGRLTGEVEKLRKRLALRVGQRSLPFMVWSAGQREFVPLLLSFYKLMPSGKKARQAGVETVVVEEPEMGLHPRGLEAVIILLLELLRRGYRVLVSTHSAQLLEALWAIRYVQRVKGPDGASLLERLFQAKGLAYIFEEALRKDYRVFYFRPVGERVEVVDLSRLEDLTEGELADWGGLTSFASRASELVSELAAEHERI